MKNVLIAIVDPDHEEGNEDRFMFTGSHDWSDAVESEVPEHDHMGRWQRGVKVWLCAERDIQSVVNQVSVWHPTSEVRVFKMDTVFYRQPGELKSKTVTKDGIVPF